jgi:hypothetical protein
MLRDRIQKDTSELSLHSLSLSLKLSRWAEEKMLYAGTKIDEQTKKALASAKYSSCYLPTSPPDRLNAQSTADNDSTSQIKGLKSDATVAFITFNYSESMARSHPHFPFSSSSLCEQMCGRLPLLQLLPLLLLHALAPQVPRRADQSHPCA